LDNPDWLRLGLVAGGLSYTNRVLSTDNVEMDGWDEDGGVAGCGASHFRVSAAQWRWRCGN
jgi:hypothetical protein